MSPPFLPGNRVTLLESGTEYFPALIQAINAAREAIFLESYIFANDDVGHRVAQALVAAAKRGVRVHVTVDGYGASNFPADFGHELEAAGVRTLIYRPEISPFRLRRHRLRRLHRKLVLIDGRLGFVGGINIKGDDTPATDNPHLDYAVMVEGPVTQLLGIAVRRLWEIVSWANFKRRFRLAELPQPETTIPAGKQAAAFLIRDNIRHRNDILHAYLHAIENARHEIILANAYFLPGLRFGRALFAAARRGVHITILLQGVTDHRLLHYATQTLYGSAVRQGIRIFEYHKSLLHAKVAVIDREWATVGSSNIDPFSLLLAKEANLVVNDPEFCENLHRSLNRAINDGATEIIPEHLEKLPWYHSLLRWISYGFVRGLVGIAGYGRQHWPNEYERER